MSTCWPCRCYNNIYIYDYNEITATVNGKCNTPHTINKSDLMRTTVGLWNQSCLKIHTTHFFVGSFSFYAILWTHLSFRIALDTLKQQRDKSRERKQRFDRQCNSLFILQREKNGNKTIKYKILRNICLRAKTKIVVYLWRKKSHLRRRRSILVSFHLICI